MYQKRVDILKGLFNFLKYFCGNFLMRAQNKITILYHGKPSNAREGNKHKPVHLSPNTEWEILQSVAAKKISFRAMYILGDNTEHSAYIRNQNLPKCSMFQFCVWGYYIIHINAKAKEQSE